MVKVAYTPPPPPPPPLLWLFLLLSIATSELCMRYQTRHAPGDAFVPFINALEARTNFRGGIYDIIESDTGQI